MTSIKPTSKILFFTNLSDETILKSLENSDFSLVQENDFAKAKDLVISQKPDLILIQRKEIDSDLLSFCDYIREQEINPRPVIVFLIDENKSEDKIRVLKAGADDAITYPIAENEIHLRIQAHLRRRQETHVNLLTGLPDAVIASNVIENCIKDINDWALLSVDLDNLRIYNESYGEKSGDQMIKALAAVLNSVLTEDDFVAHRDSDDFVFLTRVDNAETVAEEICRRFDFIAPKFYSSEDAKRGYVIGVGPKGIRRRVQLVSISVGITASNRRKFSSTVEVIQIARDLRYLAKSKIGSDWVSDRLRLPTSSKQTVDNRIKILVVEPDASMALLLRDTLEIEGYSVEIAHSPDESWEFINSWRPELILMETEFSTQGIDGWELSKRLKQDNGLSGIWIVMTTKNPDHTKALESGADLYLPKPYELQVLFSEIRYLLRTRLRSKISL